MSAAASVAAPTYGIVDERSAWAALAAVDGVGEGIFSRLLAAFGGARAALAAIGDGDEASTHARLEAATRLPLDAKVVARMRDAARDPDAITRRLAAFDGWALTPFEHAYPARLRAIEPRPPVLFGSGDQEALSAPAAVAVVGTRRPTGGGRALAARIAAGLARFDIVVVSGLAIGIDGAAHAACVSAGGRTVAVIGGGLAHPGPRAHAGLLSAILRGGGAVVGEHPPDASPSRGTFPRRNRIISGLADATLVVEAPARSGALITARHALEQGRPLFVAPGRPGDPAVAGCLALLRETPARPIVGVDELLLDLDLSDGAAGGPDGATSQPSHRGRPLDPDLALSLLAPPERAVAERLLVGAASTDVLVSATGLPAPVVAGALTLLQLRGWSEIHGALHLPAGPLLGGGSQRRRPAPGRTAGNPT